MNKTRKRLKRHNRKASNAVVDGVVDQAKAFKQRCGYGRDNCEHRRFAQPHEWETEPMCIYYPGWRCLNKYHPDRKLEDLVVDDL
jgi:hypothetical protein